MVVGARANDPHGATLPLLETQLNGPGSKEAAPGKTAPRSKESGNQS